MDLWALSVYKSPYPKKRYGQLYDGGYVVCEIPNIKYDLFLSAGIGDDYTFESAFLDAHPGLHCYAFDTTDCKVNHPRCTFIRKRVATRNLSDETNFHEYIADHERIFLKIDIEGSEYPLFQSLTTSHMEKFAQIVVEFHMPFLPKQAEVLKNISKTHYIVHFHPNNCCGTQNIDGFDIPNLFECTYIHKRYVDTPQFNSEQIPSPIDMPNLPRKPDIVLTKPPFVYPEGGASKSVYR